MKKLTYKYFLHKIKVVTWASFIIRKLLNGKVVHMTKLSEDRVITWQSCPMNFHDFDKVGIKGSCPKTGLSHGKVVP